MNCKLNRTHPKLKQTKYNLLTKSGKIVCIYIIGKALKKINPICVYDKINHKYQSRDVTYTLTNMTFFNMFVLTLTLNFTFDFIFLAFKNKNLYLKLVNNS